MDKNERDFAPMEENTLGTFRDASKVQNKQILIKSMKKIFKITQMGAKIVSYIGRKKVENI